MKYCLFIMPSYECILLKTYLCSRLLPPSQQNLDIAQQKQLYHLWYQKVWSHPGMNRLILRKSFVFLPASQCISTLGLQPSKRELLCKCLSQGHNSVAIVRFELLIIAVRNCPQPFRPRCQRFLWVLL